MNAKHKAKSQSGKGRVYILATLVILISVGMTTRLIYLQVFEKDFLQDRGDARTIRMERINAHRGIIQDRFGKPLAVSTPALSIWANPSRVFASSIFSDPLPDQQRLKQLATYLDYDDGEALRHHLYPLKHKTFVYLQRHMPPAKARQVLALKLPGIYAEREYHRFYPAGEVASHIVGFTNLDDKGIEGMEKSFDTFLAGVPGKRKVLKNNRGEIIRDIMPVSEAVPGKTLRLGIDLRIQYLAYRELKSAVSHYRAESGSMVVLEVATGQVLAMVNQPSYNPNDRAALDYAAMRNRALTDTYEPGSTVKPFTVGVALESGMYQPDSRIDTGPGFFHVGKHVVMDPKDYGVLSLSQIIAHSSQVGISKLALRINQHAVRELFWKLGFGQSTQTGFIGEGAGYLPDHRRWGAVDRVTFAYGYGLLVTPLQLAAAYLTLAKDGIKQDVHLIGGRVGESARVLSAPVAIQIKQMLAQVVTEGTGIKAGVAGYQVAGKSGTVRIMGPTGYQETKHRAFFAGMAPLQNPRLVAVVVINGSAIQGEGGGALAAPVFSRVMSSALRILNVPPLQALTPSPRPQGGV